LGGGVILDLFGNSEDNPNNLSWIYKPLFVHMLVLLVLIEVVGIGLNTVKTHSRIM